MFKFNRNKYFGDAIILVSFHASGKKKSQFKHLKGELLQNKCKLSFFIVSFSDHPFSYKGRDERTFEKKNHKEFPNYCNTPVHFNQESNFNSAVDYSTTNTKKRKICTQKMQQVCFDCMLILFQICLSKSFI